MITNYWMQTSSGKAFWPLNPMLEDMSIEEIALVLSRTPRFGGHWKREIEWYSVAQHSVLVAECVVYLCGDNIPEPTKVLGGLLHDAGEAYSGFGDVVNPMKRLFGIIGSIEDDIIHSLQEGINFTPWAEIVRKADLMALATEKRDLMEKAK